MTAWLGSQFTPADFDTSKATLREQRQQEAGQEPLFATGSPTRKPRTSTDRKRLPDDVALFGDDNETE